MKYDEIKALNWSTLKHIAVTPAYARHLYDHPKEQEDKPSYISGRAIHCAILEPETFQERYVVQPNFGDGRTTSAKQAKAKWILEIPDGAQIISQADYEMAMRCAEKVNSDQNAQRLMKGAAFEKVVQWKISGIDCKGRLDILSDRVTDLKFTRHNNLHDIYRDFALFNYHGQLSWYHDGAMGAGLIDGLIPPAAIVVHASHKSTFVDSFVMNMDNYTLEYGRSKYKTMLGRYIGCHTAKWWPGIADQPVPWVLPEWKQKADADEME